MDITQLRKKAESMIVQGAADYQRRVGDPVDSSTSINLKTGKISTVSIRRRSVDREEYHRTFGNARELLLKHGYEKSLDPKVQALYSELIPDSKDLKDKKRGILKNLRSRDEAKRLAAAKECSKAARGIGIVGWNDWPKNPSVVEALLKALTKENSTKPAEELIVSLGGIHERYYADSRIPPRLFVFFDSDDRTLQRAAILWTSHMRDRAKWPTIVKILDSNPSTPILRAALWHVNLQTPVGVKRTLLPILVETAHRKLGVEAQSELYDSILDLVDQRTKDEGKAALNHQNRLLKSLAKHAEKQLGKEDDRFKFLQTNLFR